jgi:hypothetical protein
MPQIDAADIARGVARALTNANQPVLTELPLANGRRAEGRGCSVTLEREAVPPQDNSLGEFGWGGPLLFRSIRRELEGA